MLQRLLPRTRVQATSVGVQLSDDGISLAIDQSSSAPGAGAAFGGSSTRASSVSCHPAD